MELKNEKRKLILNLAVSVDGYILDKEKNFDWIKGHPFAKQVTSLPKFELTEAFEDFDAIIMGRTSFEHTKDSILSSFKNKKIYVVSTNPKNVDFDNITFIKTDPVEFVKNLKQQEGKNIWLFGGSKLISAFLETPLIDEYVLAYVPILLGGGLKLFLEFSNKHLLKVAKVQNGDGLLVVTYKKRLPNSED